MSDLTIHPDWDREKVLAHLFTNERELDKLKAVARAFDRAATSAWVEVHGLEQQDRNFREMVSKARGVRDHG